MKKLLAALSLTLLFAGSSFAEDTPPAPRPAPPLPALTDGEKEALSKLHAAHKREIALGALAVERGQTGEIRRYGQQLVDDHTAADRMLVSLAKRKEVKLTESESATVSNMREAPNADFDRMFVSTMIKEHDQAIELVREAQEDAKDREVIAFLRATLPVLQRHRDMAERISDKAKS